MDDRNVRENESRKSVRIGVTIRVLVIQFFALAIVMVVGYLLFTHFEH